MKLSTVILGVVVLIVLIEAVVSFNTPTEARKSRLEERRNKRSQEQQSRQLLAEEAKQRQEHLKKNKNLRRRLTPGSEPGSGYYNDIPYPVAVFVNSYDDLERPCGSYPLSVDILTGNDSLPFAPSVPIPLQTLENSNIKAVDTVHGLIYIPVLNIGSTSILTVILQLSESGPDGPFETTGYVDAIYGVDPRVMPTTPLNMVYSSHDNCIYFIYINYTYEEGYSFGISAFNLTSQTTVFVGDTGFLGQNYLVTDSDETTITYNEVTKTVYFYGAAFETGNIVLYDTRTKKISYYPVSTGDPLLACGDWAYDPFSGNLYAVCSGSNGYSTVLSTISQNRKGEFVVSEIGTLLSTPSYFGGFVLPSTFTIDYLTGPGYVTIEVPGPTGYTLSTLQFDLDSAYVYSSTTYNTTTEPLWMAYAEWLGGGYY